jgi:hypothetical protein
MLTIPTFLEFLTEIQEAKSKSQLNLTIQRASKAWSASDFQLAMSLLSSSSKKWKKMKISWLVNFISTKLQLPLWLIEESNLRVKNMTLTLSLLFPSSEFMTNLSLQDWVRQYLNPILTILKPTELEEHLLYAASKMKTNERYLLFRLITQGKSINLSSEMMSVVRFFEIDTEKLDLNYPILPNANIQPNSKSDSHKVRTSNLCYLSLGYVKRSSRKVDAFSELSFLAKQDENWIKVCTIENPDLTTEQLKQINDFIKNHTKSKFGPVIAVEIGLVAEISYEEKIPSRRHKAGIFLSEPKILSLLPENQISKVSEIQKLPPIF